jgi:hypothetical protein
MAIDAAHQVPPSGLEPAVADIDEAVAGGDRSARGINASIPINKASPPAGSWTGRVSVGVDHDTAAFAVNSIRQWWLNLGRARYPNATRLLITADGGGSNGSRVRLWKRELQELRCRSVKNPGKLPITRVRRDQMGRRSNGGNPHFTKSEQGLTGCAALEFFPGAIRENRGKLPILRARVRARIY